MELTFKTSAESLKGLKSQYSTWYIAPSDRLQFRHLLALAPTTPQRISSASLMAEAHSMRPLPLLQKILRCRE